MTYTGQNIPHDSARGHAAGTSQFLDDIPPVHGELIVGIVGSPVARGRLISLDTSLAGRLPGVVTIVTARDVPGHNRFGPVVADEDLLVAEAVEFIGQPLAIIGAETRHALEAARKAITFEIEPLEPVLTIERAIERGQFLSPLRKIERGEVDAAFAAATRTIGGTFDIGGQEHFYLESQIAIVHPGERDTYTVHSSTQHTSEVQAMVAHTLGVPFNHVHCICKRMGGGFGGKETQAAQPAMMAALVARATGRAARFAYSKDDDMRFTGKRHPFKVTYKAAFNESGDILAVDIQLFSDGGCSTDLSMAVLERAMLHSDNAYYIPNFRVTGRVCKTNLPSNTAFRGFGGPQGVAAIENIIEEIAAELGIDALDVRQRNVYGGASGEDTTRLTTPYGQQVGNNTLPELFVNLRAESSYDTRRAELARFNAASHTHVKGLSLTAVKFGISFTRKALNQANALVNIYLDGSVTVSTGATEMGQGVNTRIAQIVADELGVSFDRVMVAPTSTEKNNNTSPTAASAGTDLNGAAAAEACEKLRGRLAEVAAQMLQSRPENLRFERDQVLDSANAGRSIELVKVIAQAYEQRISLGERGHYATPRIESFDRDKGRGAPFYYFTNGVAASEVLIDRFTGEMKVTRVDLLMDIGRPINPGIDRGQITGGFIQGMGWVTTEELKYSDKGVLWSYSPTTYKIPNASDVPDEFNVRLLSNDRCAHSLKRSKAVGEPPLLLGFSVFAAVKDALRYTNGGRAVSLSLPATHERIALALAAYRGAGFKPVLSGRQ